ncbi:MAG: hypothetical protein HZA77_06925 [Candidatus Schekmanbacteria bacterium]|nr:hypothetical protein [Candidatus Schekmanbacteria bacterium]
MNRKRHPIKIKNLAGNITISIIVIIIMVYFWYNPFAIRKSRNAGAPSSPTLTSPNLPSVPSIKRETNTQQLPGVSPEGSATENKDGSFAFDERYELEYRKGLLLFQNGNLEDAVSSIQKALEIRKTEEAEESLQQVYILMGLKMTNNRNFIEAHKYYDLAINIAPKKDIILAKANTYLLEGKSEEAISFLENYMSVFENDPDFLVVIGSTALENGNIEKAYDLMEKAFLLNPVNPNLDSLRKRIENATGIGSSMLEYGKTIASIKSDKETNKLTEDFIYSTCGETVNQLKFYYQFTVNNKVLLYLTSSPDAINLNSDNIYDAPGYANQIILSGDSIDIHNSVLKSRLKYLVAKNIFSNYSDLPAGNLLYEGTALKISGSLDLSNEGVSLQRIAEISRLSEVLSLYSLPQDKEKKRIYRLLALSFVDYIESNYTPAALGQIAASFKSGVTFQFAVSSVIKKGQDAMLQEWLRFIKMYTGATIKRF